MLRVEERQEFLLVQQLVRRVGVGLEPPVLQTLQNLLSCRRQTDVNSPGNVGKIIPELG